VIHKQINRHGRVTNRIESIKIDSISKPSEELLKLSSIANEIMAVIKTASPIDKTTIQFDLKNFAMIFVC